MGDGITGQDPVNPLAQSIQRFLSYSPFAQTLCLSLYAAGATSPDGLLVDGVAGVGATIKVAKPGLKAVNWTRVRDALRELLTNRVVQIWRVKRSDLSGPEPCDNLSQQTLLDVTNCTTESLQGCLIIRMACPLQCARNLLSSKLIVTDDAMFVDVCTTCELRVRKAGPGKEQRESRESRGTAGPDRSTVRAGEGGLAGQPGALSQGAGGDIAENGPGGPVAARENGTTLDMDQGPSGGLRGNLAARSSATDDSSGGAMGETLPLPGVKTPTGGKARGLTADLVKLWMKRSGRVRCKVTDQRVKMVRGRLKDGYSNDELARAMAGFCYSPFHRENGHDTFEVAMRNGGQVEKGLRFWVLYAPISLIIKTKSTDPALDVSLRQQDLDAFARAQDMDRRQAEAARRIADQQATAEHDRQQDADFASELLAAEGLTGEGLETTDER